MSPYKIKKSVEALCEELKKHYPEVFEKKYDSMGFESKGGDNFFKRMTLALYIELLKAGIKFDENDFYEEDLK